MIALYKEGSEFNIDGVSCDLARFPNKELSVRLNEGWKLKPKDLIKKKKQKREKLDLFKEEPENAKG